MTEDTYIAALRSRWPRRGEGWATVDTIALADQSIHAFPDSAKLWVMRGDLIQLGDDDSNYSLEEALKSYETALRIDPAFADAHESIGYYFDVIDEDLERSEAAFAAAIAHGAGVNSYFGLARVLAERGEPRKTILSMIDACAFCHDPKIQEIRIKIESGFWDLKPNFAEQIAAARPASAP